MNTDLALILAGLLIAGAVLLVIAYIWYFMIQGSPLRLLMMFVRTALNRDRVVDNPDAPIEIPQEPHRSDFLEEQGRALKQEALLPGQAAAEAAYPVPKAVIPAEDLGEQGETTSQSGWPIELDKDDSASPRGFLNIHYKTANDEIQTRDGNL